MLASRPLWARIFSLKTAHGVLMSLSWMLMVGRAPSGNPAKYDGCWTYPAIKRDDGVVSFVPPYKETDPEMIKNPLMFTFAYMLPITVAFFIIGAIFAYAGFMNNKKKFCCKCANM